MKVTVNAPYQIVHDGQRYTDGDTVQASDAEASRWVRSGIATEAKPEPRKPEPDPEPDEVDVSEHHVGGGWYEIDGKRYRGEEAARAALS